MSVWDSDPQLHAAAETERARHSDARLELVDARPPEYSDELLALRFSEKHGSTLRYVAAWNRWLSWNGAHCWEFDQTMWTFDLARAICRIASAEIDDPKQKKFAGAVASAKTIAAVVSLARSDRRHAAIVDQWDADTWSLNTP